MKLNFNCNMIYITLFLIILLLSIFLGVTISYKNKSDGNVENIDEEDYGLMRRTNKKTILEPFYKNIIGIQPKDLKDFVDNDLPKLNKKVILYTEPEKHTNHIWLHKGDDSSFNYKNFLEDSNIIHYFAENWFDAKHKKVTILPIGLEHPQKNPGKLKKLMEMSKTQLDVSEKPLRIMCNAHLNMTSENAASQSRNDRKYMYDALKHKSFIDFFEKKKSYTTTFKLHNYYAFELCPEGNGLDTYRFYEAIMLNTIPIVIKNTLSDMYTKHFPVVVVDKWKDVEEYKLKGWLEENKHKFNKKALTLSYWDNVITNRLFYKKNYDKLLFVHIPHTTNLDVNAINNQINKKSFKTRNYLNREYNDFFSSKNYPKSEIDYTSYISYPTFCIVSHPYTRIVNEYNYIYSNYTNSIKSLNDWVYDIISNPKNHISPQWKYIYKTNGKRHCDHILYQENISESFPELCELYNRLDVSIPVIENVGYKITNDDLTKESKELIYQYYKKDFELFGYEQDMIEGYSSNILEENKQKYGKNYNNLLFIHIPKTGGNSINLLSKKLNRKWGYRTNFNNKHKEFDCGGWPHHIPYHEEYLKNPTFTIVRNPYNRIISEYNYRQIPLNGKYKYREEESKEVNEWIEIILNEYKKNKNTLECHIIPQSEYIYTPEGILQCDHIIKFEEMDIELPKVLEIYGHSNINIPHANKFKKTVTVDTLTQKSKNLIYEFYKKDFELFGYKK